MKDIATTILAALDDRRQIEPFSDGDASFDLDAAYATADAVVSARIARGERPVGWKIGFTNRTIWDEYGVRAPIWGPTYDTSTYGFDPEQGHAELEISAFVEPRIEPEIVFRMARPPRADMNDRELLSCIDAVAHGFEVVQSIYPGWRFAAADTVAAAAMHGALLHGPMLAIDHDRAADWIDRLASFEIVLFRNEVEIDRGSARNVLDGPLAALRHFVAGLEERPMARGIETGDVVTTGTVTRAFPVEADETWSTRVEGLPLPGMRLHFLPALPERTARLIEQAAQARFRMENPDACSSAGEHEQAVTTSIAAETALSRLLLRDRAGLADAMMAVEKRARVLADSWKSRPSS
jgi:2-keto-4-pentenoate hydratase